MITIILVSLAILVGLIGYLHYIIDKQKTEIEMLYLQITVLAGATAEKIIELRKDINKLKDDTR